MSRYRVKLYFYEAESVEPKLEVYEKGDVDLILDDIETRIKEIDEALSSIKGLTEIEDIKQYTEKLLTDLY